MRDRHIADISVRGRIGWQRASGYNQRSRAETLMSRWKTVIGPKLKAPILGQNGGYIGLKLFQQLTPKAGFGGDDGDNMDVGHGGSCGLAEGQDNRGRIRNIRFIKRAAIHCCRDCLTAN